MARRAELDLQVGAPQEQHVEHLAEHRVLLGPQPVVHGHVAAAHQDLAQGAPREALRLAHLAQDRLGELLLLEQVVHHVGRGGPARQAPHQGALAQLQPQGAALLLGGQLAGEPLAKEGQEQLEGAPAAQAGRERQPAGILEPRRAQEEAVQEAALRLEVRALQGALVELERVGQVAPDRGQEPGLDLGPRQRAHRALLDQAREQGQALEARQPQLVGEVGLGRPPGEHLLGREGLPARLGQRRRGPLRRLRVLVEHEQALLAGQGLADATPLVGAPRRLHEHRLHVEAELLRIPLALLEVGREHVLLEAVEGVLPAEQLVELLFDLVAPGGQDLLLADRPLLDQHVAQARARGLLVLGQRRLQLGVRDRAPPHQHVAQAEAPARALQVQPAVVQVHGLARVLVERVEGPAVPAGRDQAEQLVQAEGLDASPESHRLAFERAPAALSWAPGAGRLAVPMCWRQRTDRA